MTEIITSWELQDKIRTELDNDTSETWLKTFIPSLDAVLCSDDESHPKPFYGGEMIIISGDEKEGKTTFARSLTDAIASQKKHSLWFSYEETSRQFIRKFGDSVPFFFIPDELSSSSVDWIHAGVKKAKAMIANKGEKLHAVFIDHLHYLVDMDGKQNLSIEIGAVCRKLKKIAIAEDIVLFLIVHTNRNEGQEEPTVRSLRDSGMIGKEADAVLFIWRLEEDGKAMVKLAVARGSGHKNRKVKLIKQGPFLKQDFS